MSTCARWRDLLTTLLALAVALAVPAHGAGSAVVHSTQRRDLVEVRASVHLGADRDTVWRVLTDYERYPAFIPDLHTSRVVARDGPIIVVEQHGDAAIGPLQLPLEITFQIHEHAPYEIESRAIAGPLRSLESRYALTPEGAGTRLDYTGQVRMGFPLFGWFARSAVEANARRYFLALVGEIERAGPAGSAGR